MENIQHEQTVNISIYHSSKNLEVNIDDVSGIGIGEGNDNKIVVESI